MITSNLFFGMDLKFDVTLNEQLYKLSCFKMWDSGLKKYVYIFPLRELDKVLALIGEPLDFEANKAYVANLIQHIPNLSKEVNIEAWKGEGDLYIQKFPKLFIIKTIMRKKPITYRLPIETVIAAWRAILRLPKGKEYSSKDQAEFFCKELGITRFHRGDSKTWDGDKYYGTRQEYFKWYYSLKVLQDEKVIKYSKSGMIERVSSKWEYNGKIIV